MSIHKLAQEIGVSEYALKKYGKENRVFRAGDSRRYSYEFSKKDIEKIKKQYKRYNHEKKQKKEFIWVFYKCILQPGNNRYSTPVGRFDASQNDLLLEFIKSQTYISSYGKLSCHFEIINNHTAMLRISKILKQNLEPETFEIVVKSLPLKIDMVNEALQTGIQITDEKLFGKPLETERKVLEIYLDDLANNTNL